MIRGRLWRMAVAAWGLLARPFRRRSALSELQALDGRTLKDLGLHRGQLWFVADAWARGVPYHDPTTTQNVRQQQDRSPSQGLLASMDGRPEMPSSQAARSGRKERQSTSPTRKSR
jgi:uncharacterized protein YjiS (DUF1127 family)